MAEQVTVTTRMLSLVDRWHATSDRRAVFLQCYLLMTENMLDAIAAAQFADPPWVEQLLHRFAGYYFDALAIYERDPAQTPPVWRVTHDAARDPDALLLQHLLLGINAHINYDLVLTLVDMLDARWQALPSARRRERYDDHCHVNRVIAATVDAVQDDVLERVNPRLDLLDKMLGPIDEWLASHMISHWREEVWHHAVQILETPDPAARARLCRDVEAHTLQRARRILIGEDLHRL
jgi:hypothetical protein